MFHKLVLSLGIVTRPTAKEQLHLRSTYSMHHLLHEDRNTASNRKTVHLLQADDD